MSETEKRNTAFHEAGHAILAYLLPRLDPVHHISIIPSGRALGYTRIVPEEDKFSVYRDELHERICEMLGGRAAEEIMFGNFSGGAANDIEKATDIARRMVTQLGMSDLIGPINYSNTRGEVFSAGRLSTPTDIRGRCRENRCRNQHNHRGLPARQAASDREH